MVNGKSNKSRHPLYSTWTSMRQRCSNPNTAGYECYGGRGIRVCARWDLFENFLADMGEKPSPEHSIDRIDVNGHYEPSNCRWATQIVQIENRRKNRRKVPDPAYQAELNRLLDTGMPLGEAFKQLGPVETVWHQQKSNRLLKKSTHAHVVAARKRKGR